jgi:hypothetical protein
MTTLLVTITSASYDDPAELLVTDTPKVRRALDHLRQVQEAHGDGSTTIGLGEFDADPDTTEADFIDWVIDDTSDGYHDAEVRALIDGEAN